MDDKKTVSEEKASKKKNEETIIYIGPTVNNLIENTIFTGTKEKIAEYVQDVIEEIPQIQHLLVPVRQLAEYKNKVATKGTILNKYYQDVLDTRKV